MHADLTDAIAAAVVATANAEHGEVATQLRKAAEATQAAGNQTLASEIDLIAQVLGMMLVPSNVRSPFRPLCEFGDRRSALPDDFDDAQLAILNELLPTVQSPDVAARIADVLWIRKRDPRHARVAIDQYRAYATQREDFQHWTDCAERLERALRLSAQLRRGDAALFDSVVQQMQQILDRGNRADPLFLSCRIMELLNEFDEGDPPTYLELSEHYAKAGEAAKEFHRAEAYWALNLRWAHRARDEALVQRARVGLAESHALHADTIVAAGGSSLAAAHWLEKAIEVYKTTSGNKERRAELYELLRQSQKATVAEMKPVGTEFDISEIVRQSLQAVDGKTFEESLFTLAFRVMQPPDYEKLREQTQQQFRDFPLSNLFSGIQLDSDGRIVARREAGLSGGPDEREVAEWQQMLRNASMQHNVDAQGVIEPIRRWLCAAHYVQERDILAYCMNNPFIAEGQELLYARGLYAGLTGDFPSAMALLIPLLENSLRYILKQQGVETTNLNEHGIQEEMHLGTILDHETCEKVLGKNDVYDLRGLLVERTYGNLRNRVAHGLMSTGEFFQAAPVYLWWLSLRYVLHTPFQRSAQAKSAGGVDTTE